MDNVDEKNYWRERHQAHPGRYKAVGIDTISEQSNAYSYQLLLERYGKLLDDLGLPAGVTALDAGAGVGTFTRLLHGRGFRVTALDISRTAVDAIDLPIVKVCSPIAEADFAPGSFQYVHSFDVLYHIMSDSEWKRSVAALALWSSRYVVLHERFLRFPQWTPSKIMRMRPREHTRQILASAGFAEVASVATHFVSKQLLTYRLANLAPGAFYRTDRWALGHLPTSFTHAISSHKVKVFERM